MRVTLKMPKVGDAADKVVVVTVNTRSGDHVSEGQILMLVETDKATVEVPSPMAGAVAAVLVAEGDEVSTGAPTFVIEG
jgi:pyruvate/2-oxoglutarate dehydrogenase complex dihydrolipoamide acyltransferase (E2) component